MSLNAPSPPHRCASLLAPPSPSPRYLIIPLYLLVTYWLMYAIFPDNRVTAADLAKLEMSMNAAVPSSCTFLAMDAVGFVRNGTSSAQAFQTGLMERTYRSCGLPSAPRARNVFFASQEAFTAAFEASPMEWYGESTGV